MPVASPVPRLQTVATYESWPVPGDVALKLETTRSGTVGLTTHWLTASQRCEPPQISCCRHAICGGCADDSWQALRQAPSGIAPQLAAS